MNLSLSLPAMKEALRTGFRRCKNTYASPPFRGEREGPVAKRREGEVGRLQRSGIPHLTPTLSAPRGGEGVTRRSSCCFALALLAGLWICAPAEAAEPNAVGIIMKVVGDTDPGLPPREEVPANTVIKLGPGAELTFLHYSPTCELVTVAGGTLKLTKTDFTTDGEVKSRQNRPCPRVY